MERDSVLRPPKAREFHPVIRRIYAERLGSPEAADAFLAAEGKAALPCHLVGLEEAVDRIEAALDGRERMAVFGHDDPDGITSAAIVIETLEDLGGVVESYIPNRVTEGHGLYPDLIRRFADHGVKLLITTDGCTTNREEADLAAELGMDVVVTDHHEVADGRSTVKCLVNPKARPGETDCTDLTGAGVAALAMRLLLHRRPVEETEGAEPGGAAGAGGTSGISGVPTAARVASGTDAAERASGAFEGADNRFFRLLDLVALGTIADYGDLGRNNRAMVVRGLTAVAQGDRPAIALVRRALEIGPPAVLRTDKASRLAAVFAAIPSTEGRSPGLDALLGRRTWAGDVDALIKEFLHAEAEILVGVDAVRSAAASALDAGGPLVVRVDNVAPRSLGKGATRLVDLSGRPAAVLQAQGSLVVGELRGPDGVNLVEILADIQGRFESWGGHRQAAGFSATPEQADEIMAFLADAFRAVPSATPAVMPPVTEIRRAEIDDDFSRSLRAAMPFGKGNAQPMFRIVDYREGGTASELDERERVGTLLLEKGFPKRPENADPLVTFEPRGGGGLAVQFEGWVPSAEENR